MTEGVEKDGAGGSIAGSAGDVTNGCVGEWHSSLRAGVCAMGDGLSIETEEVGKVPVFCCKNVSTGDAGGEGICEVVSRRFIETAEGKWERGGKGSRILLGPLGP